MHSKTEKTGNMEKGEKEIRMSYEEYDTMKQRIKEQDEVIMQLLGAGEEGSSVVATITQNEDYIYFSNGFGFSLPKIESKDKAFVELKNQVENLRSLAKEEVERDVRKGFDTKIEILKKKKEEELDKLKKHKYKVRFNFGKFKFEPVIDEDND